MIRQRGASAAPVIQGYAEDLPFHDNSFDASMAILTVHHWADTEKGLNDMRRVAPAQVVLLTFDHSHRGFWFAVYIPALVALGVVMMQRIDEKGVDVGMSVSDHVDLGR